MLIIAVTGGSCGGKTSMQAKASQMLAERLGMKVLWVSEAATELMEGGIIPGNGISIDEFQDLIIDTQISKENLYAMAGRMLEKNGERAIVFCDRGIMDNGAYIPLQTLREKLDKRGISIAEAYGRYDAVLHLVTAADGAEEFYQWNDPEKEETGNNKFRKEPPHVARELDRKIKNVWLGHPHFRVFDNSCDFDRKIQRAMNEVFSLLGEPAPTEIERKFLIQMPSDDALARFGIISKSKIIQTYLSSPAGVERRIRMRGSEEDGWQFYYTTKEETNNKIKRIEHEMKISRDKYISLLAQADASIGQVIKNRQCFLYENRYFELDAYPFSSDYAVLEAELNSEGEDVKLPPFIHVIKEVTEDLRYRNRSLAKMQMLHP